MKNILLSILLLCAVTLQAQPLLVGHRGSAWGLENSEESFTNGAKQGYAYLETDVKVTSDRQFVCCHNDDLKTWGGTLSIATNTLAALQAEQLSQTRNGVKYTGHLCSIAEYLDICNQYNVKPLIELKWGTGINNNDCSNIPHLIKLIEDKGLRSTCIFLTSMKPCLEYIRKNYPDITLQYLVNSISEAAYDFCKTYGIDVDCRNDGLCLADVRKFHAAGLKVNVWTANTNADYKSFGNMGCDFITTDRLDPTDLPELEVDNYLLPNEIDYPPVEASVKGLYSPTLVSQAAIPDFLRTTTIRKTLLKDGKLYVLALATDNSPILTILDAQNGKEIQRMNLTGITQGMLPLSDIAFTADGVLLGCNQAIMGTEEVRIYQWAADNALPELWLTINDPKLSGDWQKALTGTQMAVSGKLSDCFLWLNSYDASLPEQEAMYHLIGIQLKNGNIETTSYATAPTNRFGLHPQIIPSPMNRNHLIINSQNMQPTEYTFSWETNGCMTEYAQLRPNVLTDDAVGFCCLRLGGKVYALLANTATQLAMFDITKGINYAKAVSLWLSDEHTDNTYPDSYQNTHIELKNNQIYLYLFNAIKGISIYSCTLQDDITPREGVSFVLKKEWEKSTMLDNAPAHINGSNAQQGGAFKGYFYVNDCAEKLLYMFDSTGCIGSLPGGAGWGTAIDDAGNIIVRNDKNTTNQHKFLIYQTGTTIDNSTTPLSLDVEVPADGQTNFISASGDIWGGIGYIYMYPNGHNAINIITLNKGEVVYTELCDGLDMTGSTAGYVIPIDNNSENWIYQIRASGFSMYNGGNCESFLKGRGSTAAPARNTTIGGDYFTLAGYKFFIHPSGLNYQGGFTIRNITTNKVITSVEPIGTLGYGDGGNMSCSNWIFAEPVNQDSARIYLYCPSNGMAVYTLYDQNAVQPDGLNNITENQLSCYPNPATHQVRLPLTKKATKVELISMTGQIYQPVIAYSSTEMIIDVTTIPIGQYILRIDDKVTKLLKQ